MTRDASWDFGQGNNGMSLEKGLLKSSPAAAGVSSWGVGTIGVPTNFHHGQFFLALSPGSVTGTVRSMIAAKRRTGVGVTSAQRHQTQMVIRVVSSDGSTVRGTSLAAHEPGSLDSSFWQSSMQSIKAPAGVLWDDDFGAPLTPVTAQAGDWLVVEIGTHTVIDGGGTGAAVDWDGTTSEPDFPIEEFVPVADGVPWLDLCTAGDPGTPGDEPEDIGGTPAPRRRRHLGAARPCPRPRRR